MPLLLPFPFITEPMKLPNLYAAVAVLLSLSVLAGCGTDKEDDTNPKADFDRGAMLANYADNLIVPGYEVLVAKAAAMEAAVATFAAEPSAATLAAARAAYQEAYKAWQQVSIYEFGPADEQMLRKTASPTRPGRAIIYPRQSASSWVCSTSPTANYRTPSSRR